MTTIETSKLPKAPTFLGAFLYIFAGMLLLGTGIGMTLIGPPSYYPGAVWQLIIVLYTVVGAIIMGLGYNKFRRFFRYVDSQKYPDTGESGETYDKEQWSDSDIDSGEETLAEKRP